MQNLLAGFLQNTSAEQRNRLALLPVSGKEKIVWNYLSDKTEKGKFNKENALADLNITASHFDKICSELLVRCYKFLIPKGGINLLAFLTASRAWMPHFYKETSRQLKQLDKLSRTDARAFLKQFITLYIDSSV